MCRLSPPALGAGLDLGAGCDLGGASTPAIWAGATWASRLPLVPLQWGSGSLLQTTGVAAYFPEFAPLPRKAFLAEWVSMTDTNPANKTDAAQRFLNALTGWLQDVRFAGEAIFRLSKEYQATGGITFTPDAWPSPPGQTWTNEFVVNEPHLKKVVERALHSHWETRFVFLETLWEEYLENLILEIRVKKVTLFEEFATREFMVDLVREIISDRWAFVEDIKIEIASRFAAEITRKPWSDQWKDLVRLSIGANGKNHGLEPRLHTDLDAYFEMRNCIIHRNKRVSERLKKISPYYESHEQVIIFPTHLTYYRQAFIDVVLFIDQKVIGRLNADKG